LDNPEIRAAYLEGGARHGDQGRAP